MKTLAIVFSLVYVVAMACVCGGDLLFQKAMAANDVKMLKKAQKLNPLSSEYFYGEYRMTGDIKALVHAMRLEPTRAAYHAYYGLALLKDASRTPETSREGVAEICKGAQLKPYSHVYSSACQGFRSQWQ